MHAYFDKKNLQELRQIKCLLTAYRPELLEQNEDKVSLLNTLNLRLNEEFDIEDVKLLLAQIGFHYQRFTSGNHYFIKGTLQIILEI